MMIELASEKYRNGIISLWQEAFGDSEKFIDDFLNRMSFEKNMLLYVQNSEVCAMAITLPVFCKNIKGRYIYAVATAKEHQGKGLCKAIMGSVDEFIKQQNEKFAILVPASESLFGFYEKLGYSRTVYKPDYPEIEKTGKQCTVSEYFKIRDALFENYDLIGWDEKSLEYILGFGKPRHCENGAVYIEGETVKELLSPAIFEKKWTTPFAQIKYIDKNLKFEKPYFGLCMN